MDEIEDDIYGTFLDFKNITEHIHLIIKLNTIQETSTSLPVEPCSNIIVTPKTTGVNIQICDGKCNMNRCPFVCKWMNKKSEFLYRDANQLRR